jgi:hypothetical protein
MTSSPLVEVKFPCFMHSSPLIVVKFPCFMQVEPKSSLLLVHHTNTFLTSVIGMKEIAVIFCDWVGPIPRVDTSDRRKISCQAGN